MPVTFEAEHTEGLSRLGRLSTPHGTVITPALMPVINPNRILVEPQEMRKRFDVQIVITNAYILQRTPELAEKARRDGVHEVIGTDGPVMTDSGTFQDYVYGDLDLEPDEIVAFQRDIGTDIGTILDVFSTPDRTQEQAREDAAETQTRARDTVPHADEMALALPVQGATFPAEREAAAREMSRIEPPGGAIHPIGGVVPLMEDQRYETLTRIVLGAKRGLTPGRAVHLFGAGHPQMLPLAVYLGCDLFDSAAYAKFAHDDRMLVPWGTLHLDELDELPCTCPTCHDTTPQQLRESDPAHRLEALARHNLHVTAQEIKRIRHAQRNGRLFDLVVERCTTHPRLAQALPVLQDHVHQIEEEEPATSKSAANLLEHAHRAHPQRYRARARVQHRFSPRGPVTLLTATKRPYTANATDTVQRLRERGVHPFFPSRLGPVPYDLDEAYPFSQSVEAPLVPRHHDEQRERLEDLAEAWGVTMLDPSEAREKAKQGPVDLTRERVEATAAYQFGIHAGKALLEGDVDIETSPRTGRVKTVHADGEHVLSRRPYDGWFTLKMAGATRLHEAGHHDALTVRVTEDSARFNAEGKSVFAKFVEGCAPELRPMDECLVLDPEGRLAACGRLQVSAREALALERGVAVKVRDGLGEAYEGPA